MNMKDFSPPSMPREHVNGRDGVRITCAANRSNQLIHTICPGVKLTAGNAGVDVWDYGIATDKIKRR